MKSNVFVANGNAVASPLCKFTSAVACGSNRSRRSIPVTSQCSAWASACASRPLPHPTTSIFEMPAGCLRRITPAIFAARCESEGIGQAPFHGDPKLSSAGVARLSAVMTSCQSTACQRRPLPNICRERERTAGHAEIPAPLIHNASGVRISGSDEQTEQDRPGSTGRSNTLVDQNLTFTRAYQKPPLEPNGPPLLG